MGTTTDMPTSSKSSRALGVFSIGLGAAQLAKPGVLLRAVGLQEGQRSRAVMLGAGVRELGHGFAVLASPTAVWTRVVGDVVDLAALGRALRGKATDRRKLVAATAAVAGITVADILTTARLRRDSGRRSVMHETAAITIRKDREELYRRWRDFASFPTFMYHVESVTVADDGTSHWVVKAPLGLKVEWDAEVTEDRPGEVLGWRSVNDSDISHKGRVTFHPAPGDQGTEVLVELSYEAPGGALGEAIAKLFGEEPRQQVKDDLHRFKQIVETGEVVRSEGTPEGEHASRLMNQRQADPVASGSGGGSR